MRGPQNSRENQRADGKQAPEEFDGRRARTDPNAKVFVSRYNSLRVQVTSPADRVDPTTGRTIIARPKVAQFKDGVYKTSDEDTIQWLMGHPNQGMGRDFWLAAEAQKRAEEKQYSDMLAAVKSNPHLADRLLGDLTGDSFPVPEAPKEHDAVPGA
jgi:hypothetical protein